MHDADNRVTLPGFYGRVVPLTAQERELFARLPYDEKHWLADAGHSQAATGEAGFSTLERIWARPTAEVNGMWGGHTGPGGKTIIPAVAQAKLAEGASEKDVAFYQGKIAAARFFARNVLPTVHTQRLIAEGIDNEIMDLAEEAF